ncbi:hypothetical protein HBI38_139390 [Parastagonospora nodorum]|nr:hypothetical protein HBH51_202500 [Parastagonospora nodorum]KAH4255182.1 hypothetical protein HBI04_235120 [Parastagonospora nodorum]KAH5005794.1 hypothetical protein HBI75_226310 [Parastagonospora nodorum]KAH5664863.1 hypothetical protein HBI44_231110 [Parastagonospora nodorum]KAH5666599.1 hypothetical protein HBI21_231460 [Parastagonospora nodorum]
MNIIGLLKHLPTWLLSVTLAASPQSISKYAFVSSLSLGSTSDRWYSGTAKVPQGGRNVVYLPPNHLIGQDTY